MIELSRHVFEVLRSDKDFILYRGRREDDQSQAAFASYGAPLVLGEPNVGEEPRRSPADAGFRSQVLLLSPVAEYPAPESLKRLEHEYSLREELDPAWAARPLQLLATGTVRYLCWRIPAVCLSINCSVEPLDLAFSLRLAISLSSRDRSLASARHHPQGHQAGQCSGELRHRPVLAQGFGIASRLPRERQPPEPPEFIAGTLAYMAPEQTGRMNRSIDSRSDLYSLGVTLYEMLTGSLPFTASDPMEWVHCHIARQPVPPERAVERRPSLCLCHHHEAARQDG